MREMDRDELKARVLALLQEHQGPDNCITMCQMFYAATGYPIIPGKKYDQPRLIRSVVQQLRMEGHAIGHVNAKGGGYFLARNEQELEATIQYFRSRGISAFKVEAALRKISNKALLSQYELELQSQEAIAQ